MPTTARSTSALTSASDTSGQTRTSHSRKQSRSGAHASRHATSQGFNEDTALDLYTWGFGGQGALGNASFRDELEPFLVSALRAHGGPLLVACGFDHTMAICGDLRARGWGRAAEGQLGIEGSAAALMESPRGGGCVLTPTVVGICEGEGGAAVQALACGGMHSVLLTMPRSKRDEAVVFACGRGMEGQLGTGPSGCVPRAPSCGAVELPSELAPVVVAAGGLHSAALSSHGHVFVWGDNGCGQLGLPPRSNAAAAAAAGDSLDISGSARRADGPSRGGTAAAAAADAARRRSASQPHLLASTVFEGRAALEAKVPITVSAADVGGKSFVVRGRRTPPLQVTNLACGQYHSACCTLDGELFAWGFNGDGQLGLGDTLDRATPCRVTLPHDSPCVQVACGGRHTFVLGAYGEVSSCGCNAHGQLGHGADFGREPLKRLVECEALSDERVVQLACGGAHSAAVTADGNLYTWGKNANGQLGQGHVNTQDEPLRVESLGQRVGWVACGGAHTACLTRLGDAMEDDGRGGGGGRIGDSSAFSTARSSRRSSRSQDLSGTGQQSARYSTGSLGSTRRTQQMSNRSTARGATPNSSSSSRIAV